MNENSRIPTSLLDTTNFRDEGLKVLFVEDNESDYELMKYRLKQSGLVCKTDRVDQYEALKYALEHEEWHVIISDHRLPGFSSEEALQLVRDSGLGLPFIIVSGNIGEDVAVEAMRSGADDYLMKDNMARLAPAVERSLRTAQERKSLEQAERAQREGERRFAAIAENIPGIIFQMQTGGHLSTPEMPFVSEGVMRLFGVPPRQFLEDKAYFFQQFETDDAADLNAAIHEAAAHDLHLTWEGQIKRRSCHEERWVLLNAVGKRQQDTVIWDGVLLDISDRKRAESDLKESKEELRRVAKEFENRQEAERADIAREIHDDIGGSLTKLKADIAWLNKEHSAKEATTSRLDDMLELVEHLLASSQRIAKDLRPGILDYGLIPALEWQMKDFNKRTQIETSFKSNLESLDLPADQSTTLFRILQESLTNIIKHADASLVEVELFVSQEEVILEVRDNGKGIENADKLKQTSFGLRGMQERATAFGGWVDVNGSSGRGTTLMVALPRDDQAKQEEESKDD